MHEHSTSAKKEELGIPTRPAKRELTEKQQAAAKKRRNRNWSKKRSKKKLQEANEKLTDLPATCGSVFRDVHVIKRDFIPDINAETKQKKKEEKQKGNSTRNLEPPNVQRTHPSS
ncbi:hypothetical protein H4Q26_009768 [Puccinia striiformis f. sp. tritici PST-130]|nr:hypothetical protein H4Q26_009768 [Puccinia striiformis f. sp. tritici PST-130]